MRYKDELINLIYVPEIIERIYYLSEALADAKSKDRKAYTLSLIMFSILIENVSLFSQFAIILSFTRFKGLMKNVSNIIAWTSVDEQIHANAGIYIVNKIREEYPEMFDDELKERVAELVQHSIQVEKRILDWIFNKGEIETVSKKNLENFMKFRADDSLKKIGFTPQFNVTAEAHRPKIGRASCRA